MERIGEINKNKYGTEMKIIEFRNREDIVVEFMDKYKYRKRTTYRNFLNSAVKNVYDKTVFNVGYYGDGKYVAKIDGEHTTAYKKWRSMIVRCYDEKYSNAHPTYKDCIVCEEWHNYQNFAKWFEDNYYEIPGEIMDLDKDILIEGNKIYSPETCVFVPQSLNKIFNHKKNKKSGLPIGVKRDGKRFYATCGNGRNNEIYCGRFDTAEEAFYLGYLPMKRKIADEKINNYKEYLPTKLYDKLINYEIKMHEVNKINQEDFKNDVIQYGLC